MKKQLERASSKGSYCLGVLLGTLHPCPQRQMLPDLIPSFCTPNFSASSMPKSSSPGLQDRTEPQSPRACICMLRGQNAFRRRMSAA